MLLRHQQRRQAVRHGRVRGEEAQAADGIGRQRLCWVGGGERRRRAGSGDARAAGGGGWWGVLGPCRTAQQAGQSVRALPYAPGRAGRAGRAPRALRHPSASPAHRPARAAATGAWPPAAARVPRGASCGGRGPLAPGKAFRSPWRPVAPAQGERRPRRGGDSAAGPWGRWAGGSRCPPRPPPERHDLCGRPASAHQAKPSQAHYTQAVVLRRLGVGADRGRGSGARQE